MPLAPRMMLDPAMVVDPASAMDHVGTSIAFADQAGKLAGKKTARAQSAAAAGSNDEPLAA